MGAQSIRTPAKWRRTAQAIVSRWCYGGLPLPEFCRNVADMGLTALISREKDWETVRQFGLICSMGYGGGGTIPDA
jgi:hydroxypyruvate isomerase